MIDANVSLSRWPFRRLPYDETPRLIKKLKQQNVTQAWAGSFDALLHRDIAGVNARLAEECRHTDGLLLPFGTVDPTLPDWQEDLRRCHEEHKMPGLRLYPNYHDYTLDHANVAPLFEQAAQRQLIVQIAVTMEDRRTQHPRLQVSPVDLQPLDALLAKQPELQVVLLNGFAVLKGELLTRLAARRNLWFEISMLEGVGGLQRLIENVAYERVLFGSHFPFLTFEAARLKLRESELGEHIRTAIAEGNARKLLPDV